MKPQEVAQYSENELSKFIFDSSVKVHKALGPGLLEHAYEACLCYELLQLGLHVEQQKALPLVYNDIKLEAGYRVDLLVENKVIIEVKSVEAFNDRPGADLFKAIRLQTGHVDQFQRQYNQKWH